MDFILEQENLAYVYCLAQYTQQWLDLFLPVNRLDQLLSSEIYRLIKLHPALDLTFGRGTLDHLRFIFHSNRILPD
jgi:hypothetical protein